MQVGRTNWSSRAGPSVRSSDAGPSKRVTAVASLPISRVNPGGGGAGGNGAGGGVTAHAVTPNVSSSNQMREDMTAVVASQTGKARPSGG